MEANVALLTASVRRILGNDHDAEDVVQEVFCEAYRFSRSNAVDNWTALLRRIAQRRAIDYLRQRSRRVIVQPGDVDKNVSDGEAQAADHVAAIELASRLRTAISHLPTREAEVFTLAYIDQLTSGQIAATLRITTNAVGIAIHRAKQRLQEQFKDELASKDFK